MSYHSVRGSDNRLSHKSSVKRRQTYPDRRRYFQEILLVSFGKNDPSNTTSMGSQDFTFYSPHLSMYMFSQVFVVDDVDDDEGCYHFVE